MHYRPSVLCDNCFFGGFMIIESANIYLNVITDELHIENYGCLHVYY